MPAEPDQNDVSSALELLRDSLSEEEKRIRDEGASAFKEGNHESNEKQIRWGNTTQWARNAMVNEPEDGRMSKSKNGTWSISEKGREWLENEINTR